MEKTEIKKLLHVFIMLVMIIGSIQVVVLLSIAKDKRESRIVNATMYGQTVADSIKLTLENSLEVCESIAYYYKVFADDSFSEFNRIGAEIMADHPVIGSIYIAPKGIIQVAYPEELTEQTVGFAMLEDPEQGPRAQLAIDTRKCTVAGPHELIEGGVGFIIRNPVFIDDEFAGFTILVLNWDKFVDQVFNNIETLSNKYKFAVWKQDYDEQAVTDEDGYILRNSPEPFDKRVDIEFNVPNDVWHLVVEPIEGWTVMSEMKLTIVASIFLCLGIILIIIIVLINEDRTKQLKKEQLQNESKTIFLNNMSHDIRTPMNAILGYAGLMKNKINNPDIVLDYLKKIEESGEYLLSIINNILDMARIESGKVELDLECMDLKAERNHVISLFEEEIARKKILFSFDSTVEHTHVFADEARVTQIFVNLLSNAVKYTPEGGAIRYVVREIPCDKEGYGTYITTVSDTGIGMSKEFQEHIFDLFSRERTTTESKVLGTGLGMSIVKKLVDLMNGSIEIESELGRGSTFKVILNLKIIDTPTDYLINQSAEKDDDLSFEGKRILLAEDNDLNAEIAVAILEEIGFKIERAKDGVECINILMHSEAGYFDFILMDVQMPNLNGYETARKIRGLADKELSKIPVIAMTANAFEEDRQNALNSGMNGHISKPINIKEMIKEIQRILKK